MFTHGNPNNYPVLHLVKNILKTEDGDYIPGMIAGGCFKNLFNGQNPKDYDIFFLNQEAFNDAIQNYEHDEKWEKVYSNDKAVSFKNVTNNVRIELIQYIYGTPGFILSNFDFTITKFLYEITDEEEENVYYHPQFFEHLQLKRLVIDDKLVKPLSTFERSYRYAKYGYGLCKESKIKLVLSLHNAVNDIEKTAQPVTLLEFNENNNSPATLEDSVREEISNSFYNGID